MPREKGGRLQVKVWGEQSWYLLVDCCTWVVIVDSACAKSVREESTQKEDI